MLITNKRNPLKDLITTSMLLAGNIVRVAEELNIDAIPTTSLSGEVIIKLKIVRNPGD